MNLILEKGHSRVPVYYEQPTNIIGLILVLHFSCVTLTPPLRLPIFLIFLKYCIFILWGKVINVAFIYDAKC